MLKVSAISRLRCLTVKDVMNRGVVEIRETEAMVDVAKEFRTTDISWAPVIDERARCVGILSATDFLNRASITENAGNNLPLHSEKDIAGTFMTKSVMTVTPQQPLLRAAEMMTANHIHRLPVVDEHHRVVGVVSTMDVVAALLNAIEESTT